MLNEYVISLCIPTNGIVEWVLPVLESIYSQGISEKLYEVCVCDNGDNAKFEIHMEEYSKKHTNFIYKKSDAVGFLNQVESFQMAKGIFVKFINHRLMLVPGSLQSMIELVEKHKEEKPPIFFTNRSINEKVEIYQIDTFDEYVNKLSYHSSWSGGLGFWNDERTQKLSQKSHNAYFPHIEYVFNGTDAKYYLIDDRKIVESVDEGHTQKGRYNLFRAFAVEYPGVVQNLLHDGKISIHTFLKLKKEHEKFLIEMYAQFVIRKDMSSYELDDKDEYLSVYYDINRIKRKAYICAIKQKVYILLSNKGNRLD